MNKKNKISKKELEEWKTVSNDYACSQILHLVCVLDGVNGFTFGKEYRIFRKHNKPVLFENIDKIKHPSLSDLYYNFILNDNDIIIRFDDCFLKNFIEPKLLNKFFSFSKN